MTLDECCEKHGLVIRHQNGGTLVLDGQDVADLWRLSDYRVSSVSCGNVWMVFSVIDYLFANINGN